MPSDIVGRFHGVLISLHEFDNAEVLPIVQNLPAAKGIATSNHEHCVVGTYYRVLANIRTLLTLKHVSHCQAIAMITRALFELAIDLRLLSSSPDAAERMIAFGQVEKLRTARKIVQFARATSATVEDICVYDTFIANDAVRIDGLQQALWPGLKRLDHWSGKNLRERATSLKTPFDELYEVEYPRLSWYVHSGLTGVANLEASGFLALCGVALGIASQCYVEVLRTMIAELQIDKADTKIWRKLELARLLPFTHGAAQRNGLIAELLG